MPTVTGNELLARYIFYKGHVRSNFTVKADAFIPPSNLKLSVTRHLNITNAEIWDLGKDVARIRKLELRGRADIAGDSVTKYGLKNVPTLTPKNHVNIEGWPENKPAQKIIALQLANASTYTKVP